MRMQLGSIMVSRDNQEYGMRREITALDMETGERFTACRIIHQNELDALLHPEKMFHYWDNELRKDCTRALIENRYKG